jgi:xanthosine utilization system XapX-like protein
MEVLLLVVVLGLIIGAIAALIDLGSPRLPMPRSRSRGTPPNRKE